jgi:mRNA interferase YafQ
MRSIKGAQSYKKDFRREARGENVDAMITELPVIIATLAADLPLSAKYDDHQLTGEWKSYRECHVKADFLLVYHKLVESELFLARLGSHSELFGK